MIPVCSWCGAYIDTDNRQQPGFCSPACASAEHDRLTHARTARIARRAANRSGQSGRRQ